MNITYDVINTRIETERRLRERVNMSVGNESFCFLCRLSKGYKSFFVAGFPFL